MDNVFSTDLNFLKYDSGTTVVCCMYAYNIMRSFLCASSLVIFEEDSLKLDL